MNGELLGYQILYTAADEERKPINGLHGRGGYRTVAISTDIANEEGLRKFLEMYHYPIGCQCHRQIKDNDFKSLLFYKNWVIYTTTTTVMFSHDGRGGTLYTQHIVLSKENFLKLDNDTRYLDYLFKEEHHSIRYAAPLIIEKGLKAPTRIHHKWKEITDALKEGRNIGIESKFIPDMQGMIAELPIEDRLIPWCNMMNEPERQSQFKFFCGERSHKYTLKNKRNWRFFDLF